jgi:hypothetical protein
MMFGSTLSFRLRVTSELTSQPTWQMKVGDDESGDRVAKRAPSMTPISPTSAPAEESASRPQCRAPATRAADSDRYSANLRLKPEAESCQPSPVGARWPPTELARRPGDHMKRVAL